MKTKYRFSRNVYAMSGRKWCNKHLKHTTTENIQPNKMTENKVLEIEIPRCVNFF